MQSDPFRLGAQRWLALLSLTLFSGFILAEEQQAGFPGAFADAEIIELTETQVEGFLNAAREFKKLDVDMEPVANPERPSIRSWSESIASDARVRAIIARNGFATPESFAQVAYSLTMAVGALEMQKNSVELEQARAQLMEMKAQLPPETYAMMEQRMLGALRMFDDQPEGNLALAGKYRSEIEAISED